MRRKVTIYAALRYGWLPKTAGQQEERQCMGWIKQVKKPFAAWPFFAVPAEHEGQCQHNQALWVIVAEFQQCSHQIGRTEPGAVVPQKVHCDTKQDVGNTVFTGERAGQDAAEDIAAQRG